jgi:Tol biopolymer transport system component
MSLAPGTRLGPYEILAPLGAGGMGEVYRARDTRLGRDVAVKVLPEHLSEQPEIRARFEREAKTISALHHPHVCMLFDVGREGDTDFLVMELVEGETLAQRLQRGPLTAAELLRFGIQIADALDRAHRAGVVHRDLKPGNVMITKSGAKLMDFGLSRVTGLAAGGSGSGRSMSALTQSPTVAQALTAEGTLLGTFQYMAPEQLEGREADVRSDIWALGCVLYEMATGRRAFEGRSQASLIAAILERQPAAVGETPSGTTAAGGPPPGLDRLIRNCLAKDPEERVQIAHDVKLQLQGIAETSGLSATSVAAAPVAMPTAARRAGGRLSWAVAALAALVAVVAVGWSLTRAPEPARPVRFRLGAVAGAVDFFWPRVSPDGRFVLLQGVDSTGTVRAYVRPMDQVEAVPVPGTEGLRRAYWSPDGREIVFVLNDRIQRAPIGGGSPTVICAAQGGVDLSWGSKGLILMDGRFTDSLRVVPAGGGELRPATRISRADGEVGCGWPHFLPDGEHFLYTGNISPSGTARTANIRLGRIGSLDSKLLGRSDGRIEYAPGGWVLFLRGTTLMAQKLDLGAGRLTGEPVTLADGIRIGNAFGHFSVSPSGVMAYSRDDGGELLTLREYNRAGIPAGSPLVSGNIANPRLCPDGRRILYERSGGSANIGGDIYVYDLARATDTRLTFTGGTATTPVWSPDGLRFAYVSRRPGAGSVLQMAAADGLGQQDSIPHPGDVQLALAQWDAAGQQLHYFTTRGRLYAVAAAGPDRAPRALSDSTQEVAQQQVSPDGRWMAYTMGAQPNLHVYVESLSGTPGRWQISSSQAIQPVWARGGRELIFEGWDGRLMVVDVDTREGFHAGTPRPLFTLPVRTSGIDLKPWTTDAAGEKFYLLTTPAGSRGTGIVEVVTDFASLVQRR